MKDVQYPTSFLDTASHDLRPLNREESEMLVKALIADSLNPIPGDFSTLKNTIIDTTMVQRLQDVNVQMTAGLLLVLATLAGSRPGNLVMWAYTISQIAKNKNKQLITVLDWVDNFPFGVPSDDAYQNTWKAQKVSNHEYSDGISDNHMDNIEFWS